MKRVLFLCTGNSCRSQMAEGFARRLWGERYEVLSAGTKKHGMNARAIKVMEEGGVPLTGHFSKTLEEIKGPFDHVITVCGDAHETCPYLPGAKLTHVGFEDPPRLTEGMSDEEDILAIYRRVRDEIRAKIEELPTLLGEA